MGSTRVQIAALDPPGDPRRTAPRTASPGVTVSLPAVELPATRGPGWTTLAALAAGTGAAAILLGAWALVATLRADDAAAPDAATVAALDVLADARATRIPLQGSVQRITLVVTPDGRALLALDGLGPAPEGRVYAAWLVPPGSATPAQVATFTGVQRTVLLRQAVPRGARVGVTLEHAPPPDRPSRPLRLVARRG